MPFGVVSHADHHGAVGGNTKSLAPICRPACRGLASHQKPSSERHATALRRCKPSRPPRSRRRKHHKPSYNCRPACRGPASHQTPSSERHDPLRRCKPSRPPRRRRRKHHKHRYNRRTAACPAKSGTATSPRSPSTPKPVRPTSARPICLRHSFHRSDTSYDLIVSLHLPRRAHRRAPLHRNIAAIIPHFRGVCQGVAGRVFEIGEISHPLLEVPPACRGNRAFLVSLTQ
jgi:hypothetical protein